MSVTSPGPAEGSVERVTPPRASGGLRQNVQKLVAGNGAAQGLQFAAILVLSRIYLPSDFGILARVQSLASVAAIVASLQLHLSIPLASGEADVEARVSAVESMAVCWLALFPLLLWLGVGTDAVSAVLAVLLALANTYSSVLVYRGRFGALSMFFVARAVVAITLQVVCGVLHITGGLLVGAVAGELLSAVLLRRAAVGAVRPPAFALGRAMQTIRAQSAFTLYGTVQELISVASFYAPVFLFTSAFDAATGGQYAMANRLVFAPVVLLSGSLAQVLYHRLGQAPPKTLQDFRALLPNGWVVPVLAAACVVPFFLTPLFHLVIGARWVLASELIPLQVVWGAVFLLSTPARVVCRVRLLQRQQLLVDAGTLALIALAFVVMPSGPIPTMWRLLAIALLQNLLLALVVIASLRHAREHTP